MSGQGEMQRGPGIGQVGDPEYAEAIVNTIRDALLILDGDLVVQDANRTFYEKFAVSPDQITGRQVWELGNGQWDIPKLRELLRDVLPQKNPVQDFEVVHTFEDIGRRVMLVNAVGLPYGEPPELILMAIQDVTEQRKTLGELEAIREELEQRVRERTRQLRQAARELTTVEMRERQRISGVLHDDLQQNLVAAKMALDRVVIQHEREGVSAEALKAVVTLTHGMVDDAIDTARSLSSELSPPALTMGDVCVGLRWLSGWCRRSFGVEVTIVGEGALGPMEPGLCDLVFRAVRELLFNVVKHAGTREATVEARQSGDTLEVVVRDRGRGCDPHRLEGATAGSERGAGLAAIRERLRLLGGEMRIHSPTGGGCAVTLSLPLR